MKTPRTLTAAFFLAAAVVSVLGAGVLHLAGPLGEVAPGAASTAAQLQWLGWALVVVPFALALAQRRVASAILNRRPARAEPEPAVAESGTEPAVNAPGAAEPAAEPGAGLPALADEASEGGAASPDRLGDAAEGGDAAPVEDLIAFSQALAETESEAGSVTGIEVTFAHSDRPLAAEPERADARKPPLAPRLAEPAGQPAASRPDTQASPGRVRDVGASRDSQEEATPAEPQPFSVRDTAKQALDAVARHASEKGLELIYDVEPDVPAQVVGDPAQLREVLVQLIGAAVQATEAGEVVLRVAPGGSGIAPARVRPAEPFASGLHIRVLDTGIASAALGPPLVAPVPPDGSAPYAGETDMTASIRQVGAMRGVVWAEPSDEHGVTLHVLIPAEAVEGVQLASLPSDGMAEASASVTSGSVSRWPAAQAPPSPDPAAVASSAAPDLRLLVAEDNATNQRVVALTLKRLGYHADMVSDGDEVVPALRQAAAAGRPYDLVLMDLRMPRMGGVDAAHRVRTDRSIPQPRIVAITADVTDDRREACFAVGMDGFLGKPLDRDEVGRTLAEVTRVAASAPPTVPAPPPVPAPPLVSELPAVAAPPAVPAPPTVAAPPPVAAPPLVSARASPSAPVRDAPFPMLFDAASGDPRLFASLLRQARTDLLDRSAEIKTALRSENLADVAVGAQTVESVASLLDSEALRERSVETQSAADAGDLMGTVRAFLPLHAAIQETVGSLDAALAPVPLPSAVSFPTLASA